MRREGAIAPTGGRGAARHRSRNPRPWADRQAMTTTTTATGTPSGTTTGTPSGGRWITVAQAVAELGITERTVRRGISSGKFVSAIQDGKRVIRIEGEPDTLTGGNTDRHATGGGMVELKPNATGGLSGGELAVRQAIEQIVTLQTEQLRAELVRSRRAAAWGWSMTAAAGILLAVGAVWSVRAVEQARGQAGAAEGVRAVLSDETKRERHRADGLAVELQAERQRHQAEIEGIRQRQALAGVVEMLGGCP